MTERPYVLMPNPMGRRTRWYPDKYLEAVATNAPAPPPEHLDPGMLDPAQCAAFLPALREGLDNLARLVTMVEARANGQEAALCAECGSRFYPSRSDGRYCGGACRMRVHRRRAVAASAECAPDVHQPGAAST